MYKTPAAAAAAYAAWTEEPGQISSERAGRKRRQSCLRGEQWGKILWEENRRLLPSRQLSAGSANKAAEPDRPARLQLAVAGGPFCHTEGAASLLSSPFQLLYALG